MKRNLNDVIDTLPNLSQQDLDVLQFKLNEERARKKRQAIEAFRAEMKERAAKAGLSMADIMQDYEITANTLKPKKGLVSPKFVNPDNREETWSGRGHRPRWLREKIEQGHKLEEFAVAANGAGG